MDRVEAFQQQACRRGVVLFFYRLVQVLLFPLIRLYFRVDIRGQHHIPADGAVIICANHRSFLDSFLLAMTTWRPLYSIAKQELFHWPLLSQAFSALGAFPVRARQSDDGAMATARQLLAAGHVFAIFPEGVRVRQGLGLPRKGAARLALESGAVVVPVAIDGSERVRRGLFIRPVKVRVLVGPPLRAPQAEPTPELADQLTDRIWDRIEESWRQIHGAPKLKRRPPRRYPVALDDIYCSGGPGSLLPAPVDHWPAQRMLTRRLAAKPFSLAHEPVRVYLQLEADLSLRERVRRAVLELERLGAFTRQQICIVVPGGLGYANALMLDELELLAGGDLASVVVQYAQKRSWRSRGAVGIGRDALLALAAEIDEHPGESEQRPRLLVYGESLGAWVALAAVADKGLAARHIDRALLVGLPQGGQSLLARLCQREAVDEISRGQDAGAGAACTLLVHDSDPVASFSGQRLWRRPAEARDWLPVFSFLRGLYQVSRATDLAPGRENPHGHDYRTELGPALVGAFALTASAEELDRIERLAWRRDIELDQIERGRSPSSETSA